MTLKTAKRRRVRRHPDHEVLQERRKVFNRLFEHRLISKVPYEKYRNKVRNVYGGRQGAMLATCSMISGHRPWVSGCFRSESSTCAGCATSSTSAAGPARSRSICSNMPIRRPISPVSIFRPRCSAAPATGSKKVFRAGGICVELVKQ